MIVKMSEKPKRPMSAFLLWLRSARAQIKAQHPGFKVTQIAKKGGEIWRNMPDKRKWEEKAQKLREQYFRDLEEYKNARQGEGERGTRRRERRARSLSSSSDSYDDDSDRS